MDKNQLEEAFQNGTIRAVTIDTNIFHRQQQNLESEAMSLIPQLGVANLRFIISDVVLREIHKHLDKKYTEATQEDSKALSRIAGLVSPRLSEALTKEVAARPRDAQADVGAFVERTGAIVIKPTGEDTLQSMLDRYFKGEPPFGEKKKTEFPDAIALLSIEQWAKTENAKVLCISNDGDWKSYCDTNDQLICVDDLELVLSAASACITDESVSRLVESAVQKLIASGDLVDKIRHVFQDQIERRSPTIEADSHLSFEEEDVEVAIDGDSLQVHSTDLLSVKDETAVVRLRVEASVNCSATFQFSVYDSIDKDYVGLGGSRLETSEQVEADIFFHFDLEELRSGKKLQLSEDDIVEASAKVDSYIVDFGPILPDDDDDNDWRE